MRDTCPSTKAATGTPRRGGQGRSAACRQRLDLRCHQLSGGWGRSLHRRLRLDALPARSAAHPLSSCCGLWAFTPRRRATFGGLREHASGQADARPLARVPLASCGRPAAARAFQARRPTGRTWPKAGRWQVASPSGGPAPGSCRTAAWAPPLATGLVPWSQATPRRRTQETRQTPSEARCAKAASQPPNPARNLGSRPTKEARWTKKPTPI